MLIMQLISLAQTLFALAYRYVSYFQFFLIIIFTFDSFFGSDLSNKKQLH